jgi:CelD/BcsL family acetyltransferase involved in cellulose biosynthesis
VLTLEVGRCRLDDPALAAAWAGLQADGHVPSVFLTWQWYSALRDVPELARGIEVLVAQRDGKIVGLLPVELVRSGPLRVLGVAGWNWSTPDHLDVVAAPRQRAAVARALLGALRERRDWDVLDLDGLQAAGALATAAAEVFRAPRFLLRAPEELPITYVPLDGRIVSTHARKQVRKELRRAERGGGGFSVITEPERFPPLLQAMMQLHNNRFETASQVFATPARRRFHLLAAQRLGEAGLVRMHRLAVEGGDAAITYCLVWRDSVLFYSGGLRGDLGLTPGFAVRVSAMLAAAEAGFTEADLLRGQHGYKDRFSTVVRTDVRYRVLRPSVRIAATGAARYGRRIAARVGAAGRREGADSGHRT